MNTVDELYSAFAANESFLRNGEERIADRQIQLFVSGPHFSDEVHMPRSLQNPYTQVVEIFNADWSKPAELRSSVLPNLNAMCDHWGLVQSSHRKAVDVFEAALERGSPYCLYLRSFSSVFDTDVGGRVGRAVAYINREGLDRNFAEAIAGLDAEVEHVTCMHTDDMAFLEGKWIIPGLRVHDHTWKDILSDAISGAKLIVFYLAADSTGTDFELDEIRRFGLEARTLIVSEKADDLTARFPGFAGILPLDEMVEKRKEITEATRLSERGAELLQKLATDAYRPPEVPRRLTSLEFEMVDPRMTVDVPDELDIDECFFVTNSNIAAFSWWVVGFPQIMRLWNSIARTLFHERKPPERRTVEELWRYNIMASVGAAAMGFVSSLSAIIAVRAVTAAIVVVQEAELREQRKSDLLRVFDIAERFRQLSYSKLYEAQIENLRGAIEDDSFS